MTRRKQKKCPFTRGGWSVHAWHDMDVDFLAENVQEYDDVL